MPQPANGKTIHHDPDGNTANYDGVVSNGVLTITYVNTFDGEQNVVVRAYEWDEIQDRWQRSLPSVWQRQYTPSNPPTVPESGTYRVYDGAILRESGTYTTS